MDLKSVLASVAKPETVKNIADKTGQSTDTVQQIIENGLPLVLGQVSQNASTKKGAKSLNNALDQHSDGSILDTLGGLFGGGSSNSDGLSILGNIFGNSNSAASSHVAKKTGVDAGTVMQVLSFIAPLVLAYMAQHRANGGDVTKSTDNSGNSLIDIVTSVFGNSGGKNGGILSSILGSLFGKR